MSIATKMIGHALVAGVFFFCLQRFLMGETFDSSMIWAIAGSFAAAVLAWMQHQRGR